MLGKISVMKVSEDDEDCYLSMDDHQALICETVNAAVLDSACTKTVTGRAWRDTYLESLSERERSQVKTLPGGTVFRFGGEMKKESFEKLILPCTTAGKKVMIQTDVVDSDIPLLLSKPDMKRFGLQINMENDTAKIFDKIVYLGTTPSGHYFIPIKECNINMMKYILLLKTNLMKKRKKMYKNCTDSLYILQVKISKH